MAADGGGERAAPSAEARVVVLTARLRGSCSERDQPNATDCQSVLCYGTGASVALERRPLCARPHIRGRAWPQPRFFAAAFLAGFFATAFLAALAGFAATFAFGVSTLVFAAGFSAFAGFLLAFFAPFVGSGSFW